MTDTAVAADPRSRAQRLAEAGRLVEYLDSLDDDERRVIAYDWSFWGRPDQQMPRGRAWDVWMIRAGRGAGKTRTGAETIRHLVETQRVGLLAGVAPTAPDARDVMVEGESGIMAVCPPWNKPTYEPSKRRVTWPNGARLTLFSGEKPNRLRGPQHEVVWIDEPASMGLRGEEVLDNARLGLRLGAHPRLIITGTPKRLPWLNSVEDESGTIVTTGSTYLNMTNLASAFIQVVLGKYEGTRLGRQELHAEILDDVEGALWTMAIIEAHRFLLDGWNAEHPDVALKENLLRIGAEIPKQGRARRWRTIVAVDPPGETAECGIVVGTAPVGARAGTDHAVILADESLAGRPEQWGAAVVAAVRHWDAEAVFVEKNQGGDMVRSTIHAVDPTVVVKKITATESKQSRAEPIAALYEKGWVHHMGVFPRLEDQMSTWVPDESRSPDRLDAVVHLIRELLNDKQRPRVRSSTASGHNKPI
jgi:phage terminase large subunit-like protein